MLYWIIPLAIFGGFSLILVLANSPIFFREKNRPMPITDKAPFTPEAEAIEERAGNDKAILFIHGFPSSPATYRHAAAQALKAGYDVFVPRIPGFASDPKLFVKTRFKDWYDFLLDYYCKRRGDYKQFYIVGTSMGAAMTLKITQCVSGESLEPTAIATIAAPVFLNSPGRGVMRQPLAPLLGPASLVTKAIKPVLKGPEATDEDGMENWTGYHGLFPAQVHSLLMNLKLIRRDLKKITVPTYLIHDRDDMTVPFSNMHYIASKVSSACVVTEALRLPGLRGRHHCLFLYTPVREELFERIDLFFKGRETTIAQAIDQFDPARRNNRREE